MTALESFNEGMVMGKMSALNELMIKILAHGYSVDNIKSEINTMRNELLGIDHVKGEIEEGEG